MFSLAYSSEATSAFDESALVELARLAAIKNEKLKVTGYLTFDNASASFFQFLEGPRESVEGLMSSIERDPRHRVLSLVPILNEERLEAIRQTAPHAAIERLASEALTSPLPNGIRLFPHWTMRLLNDNDFERFDLEAELIETLVAMRNHSLGRATAPDAIIRLSRKLAVRCGAAA